MNKLPSVIILLLLIPLAAGEKAYELSLTNDNSVVMFSAISMTDTEIPQISFQPGSNYAELIDFNKKTIIKASLPMDNGLFTFYIPYSKQGKELLIKNVYDEVSMVIPVMQFADTCNNNKCELHESFETCPEDCSSGSEDDYCDEEKDNRCDPDCVENDPDCKTGTATTPPETEENPTAEKNPPRRVVKVVRKSPPDFLTIIVIFLLLIILGGILTFFYIQGNKKKTQIRQYILKCRNQGFSNEQIKSTLIKYHYREKTIDRELKV